MHTRTVAFVAGDYWIVHDRLRAGTEHSYAARWHLVPAAAGATTVDSTASGDRLTAPGLLLLAPLGTLSVSDGWVSPSYGRKQPAPVAVVSATGADADLVTVLLPGPSSEGVRAEAAVEGGRVEVRVYQPGGPADTVRWSLADPADYSWERAC